MLGLLLAEDGPIEWASAGLFALAALAAILRWRGLAELGWLRLYAGFLAGVCCLSELSFGARLFGWDMPDMRGGGELDGAHDLVMLAWRMVSASALRLAIAVAVLALMCGLGLLAAVRAGLTPRRLTHWLTADRCRALIAAASALLALALACDLLDQPRLRLVEEPLELLGAVLLVLALGSPSRSARPTIAPLSIFPRKG